MLTSVLETVKLFNIKFTKISKKNYCVGNAPKKNVIFTPFKMFVTIPFKVPLEIWLCRFH